MLKIFIYLGKGRKGQEKEGNINVFASRVPSTGDLASNPGICCRLGIELATLDSQAGTQPMMHTSQGWRQSLLIKERNVYSKTTVLA